MNQIKTIPEKDTKTRIFLTAAQLFAINGYVRVSIRQICETVGVGKPTLYYYFQNKEALLRELIEYSFNLAEEFITEHIESKDNFMEKLKGIVQARRAFLSKYPYFMRLFIILNFQSVPENIRKDMVNKFNEHYDYMMSLLKSGQQKSFIDPKMDLTILANTLIGTLNQLFFRQTFLEDSTAMDEQNLDKLFEFWKDYLFNPSN